MGGSLTLLATRPTLARLHYPTYQHLQKTANQRFQTLLVLLEVHVPSPNLSQMILEYYYPTEEKLFYYIIPAQEDPRVILQQQEPQAQAQEGGVGKGDDGKVLAPTENPEQPWSQLSTSQLRKLCSEYQMYDGGSRQTLLSHLEKKYPKDDPIWFCYFTGAFTGYVRFLLIGFYNYGIFHSNQEIQNLALSCFTISSINGESHAKELQIDKIATNPKFFSQFTALGFPGICRLIELSKNQVLTGEKAVCETAQSLLELEPFMPEQPEAPFSNALLDVANSKWMEMMSLIVMTASYVGAKIEVLNHQYVKN